MYMARARPCTQSVHGRTRAMHKVRPCSKHGRVRSRYAATHGRVPDRVRTVYTGRVQCTRTAVFTARVHGRVRTMYTAVHSPSMTRTRPCSRSYTLYTAVFTDRVRGRVPCTCTCLRPVYTAVHGRVQTAYGPLHGPFMTRTRLRPPHGRVYSPFRVHGRSLRVRTVYTTIRCIPGIANVDNRNLLDGYYANPIIRSLENDLFTFSVAVTF